MTSISAWLDGASRLFCYIALCRCPQGMPHFQVAVCNCKFGPIPAVMHLAHRTVSGVNYSVC